MDVSIVICTYNRSVILGEVLDHLFEKVEKIDEVEVVIVDNNSTDDTKQVVESFSKSNLEYCFEARQGLSFARNRGHQEATRSYVLYLDDDALASCNLIEEIQIILEEYPQIKAIGGIYTPWYRYGKPEWFKDEYASKSFKESGVYVLKDGETISGGIMLFKKDIFQKYSFNEKLGMNGGKVFYGEETALQYALEKDGIPVYGTNRMKIEHIVQEYKLNTKWFFKSKKAQVNSMILMEDGISILKSFKGILIGLGFLLKGLIFNTLKLFSKNYYKENFLIDTLLKPYKWFIYSLRNLGINE